MKCTKEMMRLYAVTDRSRLFGESLSERVEKALRGGVTCLQLREKNIDRDMLFVEAQEIKAQCHRYKVPFIINDDVETAIACSADGVHVGQKDMEAGCVRKLIGEDMILGVSVQTAQQARLAEKNGADYLGVGAVFPTDTKADADYVSYDTLREICGAVSIPVTAIGGICEDNINRLLGSGADGVAVVSAIFASDDAENACRRLYKLSKEVFGNEN